MSLCPSSSHQLVAAAIAFRRARRKFPKDFGLQSAAVGCTKTKIVACHGESVNQTKSSSSLVKCTNNSRFDRVRPSSVRNSCHDDSYTRHNSLSINCNCCDPDGNEDISKLRDVECDAEDAVDTVPSRECEELVASSVNKNKFTKAMERDRKRCDVASKAPDDEAAKTAEWIPQAVSPIHYNHREARCLSRKCANRDREDFPRDLSDKWKSQLPCGGDRLDDGRNEQVSTNRHGSFNDLYWNAEKHFVSGHATGNKTDDENVRPRLDTLIPCDEIPNSLCQYRCDLHSCNESALFLLKPPHGRCCDSCHYNDHPRDCLQHRCCQRNHYESITTKRYGKRGCTLDGEAQRESYYDEIQDEDNRSYMQHCCSENSGIISVAGEQGKEHEEDDNSVAVINHKDSMCILAEKYKIGRRREGKCRKCRACLKNKNEYNKLLTSGIIDQLDSLETVDAVPQNAPSVKHVCQIYCESCGTTTTKTCNRRCRHEASEDEYHRLKSSLNKIPTYRCYRRNSPRQTSQFDYVS